MDGHQERNGIYTMIRTGRTSGALVKLGSQERQDELADSARIN